MADELIFRTKKGKPICERSLVKRHSRANLEQAGLAKIRLYDLRHTSATLALAASVPVKVISEQLGHANTAFTLDTNSHVLPHMQDQAVARIEGLVFGFTQNGIAELAQSLLCGKIVSSTALASFKAGTI